MPIYEYRCQACQREVERLCKYVERDEVLGCGECGGSMLRFMSVPHLLPDGVYSYCPNVGSADTFDRKRAKIEKMNEAKRDGERPKLIDQI